MQYLLSTDKNWRVFATLSTEYTNVSDLTLANFYFLKVSSSSPRMSQLSSILNLRNEKFCELKRFKVHDILNTTA